ncbi:MAG: chemotaxis protein CheX [Bdellovibrionota bacterium]
MSRQVEHPLEKVSKRVLEDWGMMMTDEVKQAECPFDESEPLYMAWVNIHGYVSGALSIVTQRNFMQNLASNLLGADMDEAPSDDDCRDALKEMSNVLAGNYFTEAYGDDVVFDLINPNVTEVDFQVLEKIAERRVRYYFLADDSPVVVTFSIRE